MLLRIDHETHYSYSENVRDNQNELRMTPYTDAFQKLEDHHLAIDPPASRVLTSQDFYRNHVSRFHINQPHRRLSVHARSVVRTLGDLRDGSLEDPSGHLTQEQRELFYDFLNPSQRVQQSPALWRFAVDATYDAPPQISERAARLSKAVHQYCQYVPGATTISTTAADTLASRRGVCQDFAHLLIAACRAIGIPARYVSGYFLFGPEDAGDSGATHAWMEYFAPGVGWIGVDPTHDRRIDERYVKIAVGRDYGDVRPMAGTYSGNAIATMRVNVQVRTLN